MEAEPSIAEGLAAFGIPAASAPPDFRAWCQKRCPQWRFAHEFMEAIPLAWQVVAQGDWNLCYLAPPHLIVEMCERCPDSGLLAIGCLMNAAYVVIDTRDEQQMTVGAVWQEKAMATDVGPTMERELYYSFPMSYAGWLRHIWLHPEDNRYT